MLCECLHSVARRWEALQVELHGMYSVERLRTLQAFSQRTGVTRVVLCMALTPIPCLLAAILPDLIPLEAPETGLPRSHMFWVREFVSEYFLTLAFLEQARHFLVGLPQTLMQMFGIALLNSTASTAFTLGLAYAIGYPVPFMGTTTGPVACAVITSLLYLIWRPYLQRTPSLRADVSRYGMVVNFQLGLVFIYPAYTYAFNLLSGFPQTVFALLLPIMKLGAKNVMNRFIQDKEDAKAEFVNFNVEVFHALFVACCLQGSTSFSTTTLIIVVDFAAACISIYDVHSVVDAIQQCIAAATLALECDQSALQSNTATVAPSIHYVDAALFLLEHDERLRNHSSIRILSHAQLGNQNTHRKSSGLLVPAPKRPGGREVGDLTTSHAQGGPPLVFSCERGPQATSNKLLQQLPRADKVRVSPLLDPLTAVDTTQESRHLEKLTGNDKRVLLVMSDHQRLEFVLKVLKALHMTEFMLVVEFTEVMVPMVYSVYVAASYQLSNRDFYTPFLDKSASQVSSAIASVMIYAVLEVLSLVFVCVMLQRKLRISALHQLAFVLDTQWQQVQAKLVFWVVISLQSLLLHYGVDFTFQFKWLHTNPTS